MDVFALLVSVFAAALSVVAIFTRPAEGVDKDSFVRWMIYLDDRISKVRQRVEKLERNPVPVVATKPRKRRPKA